MEDHLKNKDRLDREWESLCAYEAELCSTTASTKPENIKKNRYTDVLPCKCSLCLLYNAIFNFFFFFIKLIICFS